MDQPTTDPYRSPDGPPPQSLWKTIAILVGVIVLALVIWWTLELGGNAARRDTNDSRIEPLEPAAILRLG